jgi:hypothetical protein
MRKRNLLVGASVALGILGMPLWCAATKWSDFSETPHSATRSSLSSHSLPFSFEQVLSYFDDAFEKPAHKVHDNAFVYIENDAQDEAVTIAISATERKISVTLIARGDFGVNYIREFFEAPFFLGSESEQLYALLDVNPSAHAAALGRFDAKIDVFETLESIMRPFRSVRTARKHYTSFAEDGTSSVFAKALATPAIPSLLALSRGLASAPAQVSLLTCSLSCAIIFVLDEKVQSIPRSPHHTYPQ